MKTTRKLHEKIAALKDQEATEAYTEVEVAQQQNALLELGMVLGASGALHALSQSSGAKLIKSLQFIRETKSYKEAGFDTFENFLNKYQYAPMNYAKFNRLEKQFLAEGEAAFDTLNALGIPLSQRKLLTGGTLQIEGDKLYIGQHDNEQVVPLNDRTRVVEVIKALADKNSEQSRTIERGQSEVTKLKKKLDQARKAASAIRRADTPTHDQALMDVLIAMGRYAEECQKLSDEEVAEVRDKALNLISEQWQNIRIAHRFPDAPPATAPLNGHRRSSGLSDADLEDLQDVM